MNDADDLYIAYRGAIFEFIRRRVQVSGTTQELAEDLTQDVFRKAYEALRRGVEVEQPSAWLYAIARHVVIDYYRQRARRCPTVSLDSVADEAARDLSPFEQVASDIGCEEIWVAIGRLSDRQAEILALQAQGGYRGRDLARETGQSMEGAKQLLLRGRAKLKQVLTIEGYEP